MTDKKFIFHSDCGHGWLQVSYSDIKELGIEKRISNFSYCDEEYVYLEEDCDAPLFIMEFNLKYEDWSAEKYLDYISHETHAPCRSFNHYIA